MFLVDFIVCPRFIEDWKIFEKYTETTVGLVKTKIKK